MSAKEDDTFNEKMIHSPPLLIESLSSATRRSRSESSEPAGAAVAKDPKSDDGEASAGAILDGTAKGLALPETAGVLLIPKGSKAAADAAGATAVEGIEKKSISAGGAAGRAGGAETKGSNECDASGAAAGTAMGRIVICGRVGAEAAAAAGADTGGPKSKSSIAGAALDCGCGGGADANVASLKKSSAALSGTETLASDDA